MIYTKQEWYTPAEIAVHNTHDDCWVSLNGKVLDLTNWVQEQMKTCRCLPKTCTCPVQSWFCEDNCVEKCPCFKQGYFYCDGKRLVSTILAFAGKDVSHWFNGDEWVQYTHPVTGVVGPYYRFGAGRRQPAVPSPKWRPLRRPWWLDDSLVKGKATAKTRPIRITNSITGSTVTLEVCSEETVNQIMMRYLPHNSHAMSYSWRYLGRRVCFQKTLAENGIPDERDRYNEVALPDNLHIPAILLYYNDDLTEDPPRDDCFCTKMDCVKGMPEKCYQHIEFRDK